MAEDFPKDVEVKISPEPDPSSNNVRARRYYHLERATFPQIFQLPIAAIGLLDGKTLLNKGSNFVQKALDSGCELCMVSP